MTTFGMALTNPSFTTRSYAAQTEPLLGKTLIQLDGREHALQRGLLTPSFSATSIRERFSDLIGDTIDELIAAVASHGEADLVRDLVVHLPVRIMAGLLGLPAHDRDRFRGVVHGPHSGCAQPHRRPRGGGGGQHRARRARRLPAAARRHSPREPGHRSDLHAGDDHGRGRPADRRTDRPLRDAHGVRGR